jgi:hypothetical protein
MKIQFSPDELRLLADALVRHTSGLRREIARTEDLEFKHILLEKLDILTCLQSQLATGEVQLSTANAGVLAEVLDQSEHALYFEIARTDDRKFKHMLQENLTCMESAHCKLTQACSAA